MRMAMTENRRKQTDYDRSACNVLCWIIGAALAGIAVTMIYGGA